MTPQNAVRISHDSLGSGCCIKWQRFSRECMLNLDAKSQNHSIWAICIPCKPLLLQKISNFSAFILGGQFLLPQRANNGKRELLQLQNWMRQRVFSALDIQTGPFVHPSKPLLFQKISILSLSYWEANSYYPRGPIMGKGNPLNLKSG